MMQDRGMTVVPDFMANAAAVPEGGPRTGRLTFDAGLALAQDRVREAMGCPTSFVVTWSR